MIILMKKILVPTDFSKASEAAAHYSVALAAELSAKVELIHVVNAGTDSKHPSWKKIETELTKSSADNARRLIAELGTSAKVTYKLLKGFPFHEIVSDYAEKSGADIVAIGSRGAYGVKKALVGSNAATLISSCQKPVLVIPAEAKFAGIKKIVYPTDMTHLDAEVITVVDLARPLDAEVIVLHVTSEKKRDRTTLRDILARMAKHKKLRLEVVENPDVVNGIDGFILKEHADMLAMFTHELTFFEKLFGLGVTRALAFHGTVPLLAIKRLK
jgi:nucleotide-binding universal stress UspA family protein